MAHEDMNNSPLIRQLRLYSFSLAVCGITFMAARAEALIDAEVLVDFDATWRYHDENVDSGTEWRRSDYDDSDRREGPALLGYDTWDRHHRWPEPGLQTELNEHQITYYFRKTFDYEGPTDGMRLRLERIIDDGAVYYLNGEEIARSELMTEGEIGFDTRATGVMNSWREHETFEIADEGRVIPVLAGIGNHEVRGGYYWGGGRGRDAYEDTDAFGRKYPCITTASSPFPATRGTAFSISAII